MKYLTDSEILKWNDRLEKSNFRLIPRYNTRNGHPDISINYVTNHFAGTYEIKETLDSFIDYQFSFSIIRSRKDDFFMLFKRMLNNNFGTQVIHDNKNKTIDVLKEEFIIKSEIEHRIVNRDFIKYNYKFSGKLSSIIAYVSYLEDTINFFQLKWGYDEHGNEICLTKYRIGDIVSFKEDKSKDYLVIDYDYVKLADYRLDYCISEISDINSNIIKYGDVIYTQEKNLSFSRNNRIDNILN